jgi:dTDP-4-dehydrorhamnose reductase
MAVSAADRWQVSGLYWQHPFRLPVAESRRIDLRSDTELTGHLDCVRPQIIAHLAAYTDVDWCETHPQEAQGLNVETTRLLASWAAVNGCKFLFMSTDSVFDGYHGPYSELERPAPRNCYAATKFEAEQIVRGIVEDHLIVRGSFYGWNAQNKSSLAEWVLTRLQAGLAVSGFTDVTFSPLLVNTLAEIVLRMLERDLYGTYHVASCDAISKNAFAIAIADIFGFPTNLVQPCLLMDARLRAPRPLDTSLRADKLRRDLGITLPFVRQDLLRFKHLRDDGYVSRLRSESV